jgi:hypothetical protein
MCHSSAVTDAEAAVQQQAAIVRELKDVQGLKNDSIEVQSAVATLLELKTVLKGLQQTMSQAQPENRG